MRTEAENVNLPQPVTPDCQVPRLLKGQKALVTGANSGIGKAVAIALGQAGADAMFAKMLTEFGTVDILVNNAGLQKDAPLEEMTLAQWNTVNRSEPDGSVPLRAGSGSRIQAAGSSQRGLSLCRQDHLHEFRA